MELADRWQVVNFCDSCDVKKKPALFRTLFNADLSDEHSAELVKLTSTCNHSQIVLSAILNGGTIAIKLNRLSDYAKQPVECELPAILKSGLKRRSKKNVFLPIACVFDKGSMLYIPVCQESEA